MLLPQSPPPLIRFRSRAVAASSEGLRSLVEALLSYQHRSEALVLRMLGHETGQGNAWHLLALLAGVWVVGGFLGGRRARTLGMLALGASLATERALLTHLAPYLQLGEGGTVRRGPAPGAVRNAEPVSQLSATTAGVFTRRLATTGVPGCPRLAELGGAEGAAARPQGGIQGLLAGSSRAEAGEGRSRP